MCLKTAIQSLEPDTRESEDDMRRRDVLLAGVTGALGLPVLAGAGQRQRGDGYKTIPYRPVDAVPYFQPGPQLNANMDKIDARIRPPVRAINRSGWVWTAESCQGGHEWSQQPEVRLVCRTADFGAMLESLTVAQAPANLERRGTKLRLVVMESPDGWSEARVWAPDIAYFVRLARVLR